MPRRRRGPTTASSQPRSPRRATSPTPAQVTNHASQETAAEAEARCQDELARAAEQPGAKALSERRRGEAPSVLHAPSSRDTGKNSSPGPAGSKTGSGLFPFPCAQLSTVDPFLGQREPRIGGKMSPAQALLPGRRSVFSHLCSGESTWCFPR